MVRVGAVSMFLIHSSVVDQLLSALQYSPPIDGKHFLLHSMNYSYMEGGHVIVVSVVVIFLVLYVLVLPIVTTLAIFSQFNVPHKRSEWINKSIGFLTKGYRRTYMWWEVGPVLIRKMLLMLTSRIVASSFDQSLIALLIVAIAYNLQVTIRPFDQTMYLNSNSYANDCEQLSLGTITVSLFVSLLYTQYTAWSTAFTIGLAVFNIAVMIYLCLTVMIELRYESEVKINKQELLKYNKDVECADHVLMCILPSFSWCLAKNARCCQRCFPGLTGLNNVSKKSTTEVDARNGNGNVEIEMTGRQMGKRTNTRSFSGHSVGFKMDDPHSLDEAVGHMTARKADEIQI